MNHLIRIFLLLTVVMILVACGQNDTGNTGESAKPVNDSAIAVKLLDVSRYKPLNVFAKYQGPDISSLQNDTSAHYNLEAVFLYDELTFGAILEKYMDAGFPKGNYNKEDFEFKWLDKPLRAELEAGKDNYKGNPDIFLGTNGLAKLWFLNKKILIKLENK
jgi:hypothetical protein